MNNVEIPSKSVTL